METSVESSPSPITLNKESGSLMGSSPIFSPSSDKRLWSALHNRVDTLLQNQKHTDQALPTQNAGGTDRRKRLKEESLLLLRGFDSVSYSLSQLSGNLETALQGARDLARPPTLSEILHSNMEKSKINEKQSNEELEDNETEEGKRGLKRKMDSKEFAEYEGGDKGTDTEQIPNELGNFKKAKNIAISMAKKAAYLARELKSMKSDFCFLQEHCTFLEEENRRYRDGFAKGIRPEEDDLMRLQMEALLAEKSRLANENANLTRENQCLNQLVEYHQLTSQEDLSESSYEHAIRGMCLDFSSPPPTIAEGDSDDEEDTYGSEAPTTPQADISRSSTSLDD